LCLIFVYFLIFSVLVTCLHDCHVFIFDLYIYFFFQAEDGIRVLVRSRGLGDVYKETAKESR